MPVLIECKRTSCSAQQQQHRAAGPFQREALVRANIDADQTQQQVSNGTSGLSRCTGWPSSKALPTATAEMPNAEAALAKNVRMPK